MTSNIDIEWIRQNTSLNIDSNNSDPDMVIDTDGSIYVTYYIGLEDDENRDIVVAKLDSSGNIVWINRDEDHTQFNTDNADADPCIDISDNYVHVAFQIKDPNYEDLTIIKLMTLHKGNNGNNGGEVNWVTSERFYYVEDEGINYGTSELYINPKVKADSDGNTYLTYGSEYELIYGEETSTSNTYNIYLYKINNTGEREWYKKFASGQPNDESKKFETPFLDIDDDFIYLVYAVTTETEETEETDYLELYKLSKDNGETTLSLNINETFLEGNGEISNPGIIINGDYIYLTFSTDGTVIGGESTGSSDLVVLKLNKSLEQEWIAQDTQFNYLNQITNASIVFNDDGDLIIGYTYFTQSFSSFLKFFKLSDEDGSFQWIEENELLKSNSTQNYGPISGKDEQGNIYIIYITDGLVKEIDGDNSINNKSSDAGNFDMVLAKFTDKPSGDSNLKKYVIPSINFETVSLSLLEELGIDPESPNFNAQTATLIARLGLTSSVAFNLIVGLQDNIDL